MSEAAPLWAEIGAKYRLIESNVDKLASWWHTDADLGRKIECVNDMTKSRELGFMQYQETPASFFELFEQLKKSRVIPSF